MDEHELSQRLTVVAQYLIVGKSMADIGSDHAYLPCYAYLKGIVPYAVAGELNEGPYLSAKQLVEKLSLNTVISVRKGDGLSIVNVNEVHQITIAGMGGSLITSILAEGQSKLKNIERLILQPNVASDRVREWLATNGWRLHAEDILEEGNHIYEVLVAEPGNSDDLYASEREKALLFGPFLMQKKSVVFRKKWQLEYEKTEKLIFELQKASSTEQVEEKINKKKKRLEQIKEILA